MSNQINFKQKYEELKMKFMESVDTAFRLGYEQGAVQAQQDAQMQQQQQQQEQQAAMQGGGQEVGQGFGAEGSPAGAEQQANPNGDAAPAPMQDSENPAGSELDQHIAKLESMLKSESPANPADLILLTNKIQNLRKSMSQAVEMKKSQMAIPGIAKALHKPAFKIGVQASHNMNSNAKAAVGMQEKIVNDIMKSWADEEQKASKKIGSILSVENLSKKE